MNDNLNNNMNDMQNIEQNDYYNNDSYYTNNNYDDNYSDTTYEEKEKKNGIWWKILLVILIILIIIFLLLKFCGSGGKKSKDVLYTELTTRICTAAETYVMNNPSVLDRTEPGKSAVIKFKTLADANLIEAQIANPYYDGGLFSSGKQPKYYSMDNSVRLSVLNDGTLNCEMVDNANDVTAPELRLNGDVEITLALGTDFEDPGYSATDDYDGDITDKVVRSGNVDSKKAGTYELTYTVQDSAGNVTTKKRKVIYEEYADIEITLGSILDGVTPQISLKGSNPYCMVKGTQYVEPGAVATDNVDGNITDRIAVTNKVTGNLMGSFRVVYKVEDSSGNEAIAYRAVIVTTSCPTENESNKAVNTAPTITLVGKTSVTVNIGTNYIDLGATAYDKEDGDITSRIVTDTTVVNTNAAGIYKVIYRVTDSGGLTSTATRTVTVKQAVSSNPVVRFTEDKKNVEVLVGKGSDSLIKAPKAVNENGVAVSVSTRIEDYATKEAVGSIDWNKAGKYRVIYTAVHGNGTLKQTKTIVVTILEDKVTIGGKDAINVILRSDNCDINEADLINGGVTFTAPSNKTPIVVLAGNEGKACKIGTYEVIVGAKIDNGDAVKKSITVYVVNGTPEKAPEGAPSKVTITGNTANPSNVYNTNNVWVGGAVTGITISFASTPVSGSEIAHFEWSSDCKTSGGKISKLTSTTGTLTWTESGNSSVCVRAVTTKGVEGPWSDPVKLLIDRTGPTVEFTHDWVDDVDAWHNTPTLTVEYKATDSESGLDHFEYTYDDVKGKKAEDIVTYNEATGKLTVSEDTEPTRKELFVYVRAVDKAGNKGEWTTKPAYTNIDTVKPNAPELTVIGDNTAVVKIEAKFTDGTSVRPSGFGKLIYTLDDGEENEELTQIIDLPENESNANVAKYVKVWAVDKAGNKSDTFSAKNVVIAPGVKVTGVELKNGGTKIESGASCSTSTIHPQGTFTLTATPIPSNASIKDVVWSVADANIATVDENGKVVAKNVGLTVITAKIGTVSTTCTLNVTAQVSSTTSDDNSGGSSSSSSGNKNGNTTTNTTPQDNGCGSGMVKNNVGTCVPYWPTSSCAGICDSSSQTCVQNSSGSSNYHCDKKTSSSSSSSSSSSGSGSGGSTTTATKTTTKYVVTDPKTGINYYSLTLADAESNARDIANKGQNGTVVTVNKVTVQGNNNTEVGSRTKVSDIKINGTSQGTSVVKNDYSSSSSSSSSSKTPTKTTTTSSGSGKTTTTVKNNVTGKTTSTTKTATGTRTTTSGSSSSSQVQTGGRCFLKGTKVLTSEGYKDIDKISVNDIVLSYNEETKQNEFKKVTKLLIHENVSDTLYTFTINNNIVEASSAHRFYIKTDDSYEWKEAEDLQVGDIVMDSKGNYYPITNVTSRDIQDNLYNIEVEDNHNYYVTTSEILVHNAKTK